MRRVLLGVFALGVGCGGRVDGAAFTGDAASVGADTNDPGPVDAAFATDAPLVADDGSRDVSPVDAASFTCPTPVPTQGSACASEGARCSYMGKCPGGPGSILAICKGARWLVEATDCADHCPGPPAAPALQCDASLCGNGKIDSCQSCQPSCGPYPGDPPGPPGCDGGQYCVTVEETCDGADLGGASCASLGFSGGTLACGAWCGFDPSGCDLCAHGPNVPACERAPLDAVSPTWLAAAANDTDVALAWVSGATAGGQVGVHFARFGAELGKINETGCFGPTNARSVAIAAVPAGWLVAVGAYDTLAPAPAPSIQLQLLDQNGLPKGSPRTIPGGMPMFAQRPGAGPLLTYTTTSNGYVGEVLAADGSPLTKEFPIFGTVVEPEYGSAVFTGDAFLVAQRAWSGVNVVRVGVDGVVGTTQQPAVSESEYPQISWNGTDGRIVYADFTSGPKITWRRISGTGAGLGAPVDIAFGAGTPPVYDPCPVLPIGGDTAVLLGGYTGGTGMAKALDVMRVSATGATLTAPFPVDHEPPSEIRYRLVQRGSDAIVAWISAGQYPGGIGLARVQP